VGAVEAAAGEAILQAVATLWAVAAISPEAANSLAAGISEASAAGIMQSPRLTTAFPGTLTAGGISRRLATGSPTPARITRHVPGT